jgi:hypothetical protein
MCTWCFKNLFFFYCCGSTDQVARHRRRCLLLRIRYRQTILQCPTLSNSSRRLAPLSTMIHKYAVRRKLN